MNSARAPSPVDSVASKIVKPLAGSGIRSSFAHFRVTLLNGIGAKCNPKYIIFVIICVLALVFYMLAMGDTGKPVVSTPVVTETPAVQQKPLDSTLTQVKELKSDIRELADASSDYEDRIKALEAALGDPKSVETPLLERLEAVEEGLRAGPSGAGAKAGGSGGVDTATLSKIKALETLVSKLLERVKDLEDAPPPKEAETSGGKGDHTETSALTTFMDQLRNMDDRLADVEKKVESVVSAPPAPSGGSGEKGASDVSKEDVQTLQNTLNSLEITMKDESKARRKMEDELGRFNTRLSSVEHAREKMRADMMDLVKQEVELEAKKAALLEAQKAQSEPQVNNAAPPGPTAPTTLDKSKQGAQAVPDSAPSSSEKAGSQVKAGEGTEKGDSSRDGGGSAKKGTDSDAPSKAKKAPAPAAPVDAPAKPITSGDEDGEPVSKLFAKKSGGGKSKGSKLGQDGAGQLQQQEVAAPEGSEGAAGIPSSKKGKKDEQVEKEQGIAVGEPHPGSGQGDTSSPGGAGSKGSAATVPVTSAATHEGEAGEDGDNIGKLRMKAAMKVAQEGLADGLKDTLEQAGAGTGSSQGEDSSTGSEAKAEVGGRDSAADVGKDQEEGEGQQHPLSAPGKKSGKKKAPKDSA